MGTTLRVGVPLLFAACGTVTETAVDGGAPADAPADAEPLPWPDAGPTLGDWGAPQRLDGISDPAAREVSPTVTADGLELWFVRLDRSQQVTLWRSQRASVADAWGTPETFPRGAVTATIEISPDGLELFGRATGGRVTAMRRPARDAAWPATMPEIFDGTAGNLPTLGDDGLTIYYTGAGLDAPLIKRQRFTLAASWGDAVPSELAYPRPPHAETEPADKYASIDLRGDTLLLSDPSFDSALPTVAQLTRLQTGLWDGFRAVPAMAGLAQCELVSRTEAICSVDTDDNGSPDDLARVTREVQ